MTPILVALSLPFQADLEALGSPHWPTREAAHYRLRTAGPLAAPALWLGAGSPDPEIRTRCELLGTPAQGILGLAAMWALVGDADASASASWWTSHPVRLAALESTGRRMRLVWLFEEVPSEPGALAGLITKCRLRARGLPTAMSGNPNAERP